MFTPVDRYAVAWDPNNHKGKFFIYLQNNPNPLPFNPQTAEEFIALLLMLSKNGLQWDGNQNLFELLPRPVGT